MTIDAGSSSKVVEPNIRSENKPQGVVFADAEVKRSEYEQRLFFYHQDRWGASVDEQDSTNLAAVWPINIESRFCRFGGKYVEIWRNCLAFSPKIYYNNIPYNVVGPLFMQGIAGLRKVAEVVIVSSIYLKLLHIANSKGTIVAK